MYGYAPEVGTGSSLGVEGSAASASGTGVVGEATATNGPADGVRGTTASSGGIGVAGYATNTTGNTNGVFGVTLSASGIGGLFRNDAKSTEAKILVAEDSALVQRFSVDTSGNVNVIRGTQTTVVQHLVPVNHARKEVTAVGSGGGDNLFTLDWAFPFPDESYTATCSYQSPIALGNGDGVSAFKIYSVSASSVTVDVEVFVENVTITIHCIGVHD